MITFHIWSPPSMVSFVCFPKIKILTEALKTLSYPILVMKPFAKYYRSKFRWKRWVISIHRMELLIFCVYSHSPRLKPLQFISHLFLKVFGLDFVLCLVLGSFLEDPILLHTNGDLRFGTEVKIHTKYIIDQTTTPLIPLASLFFLIGLPVSWRCFSFPEISKI